MDQRLVCQKGEQVYVVYPNDLTSYEFEVAETLATRVSEMTGTRPVLLHGGGLPEGAPALIVGRTACEESLLALSDISYGEGLLRYYGNRAVFICHNGDVLPALASAFLNALEQNGEENGLAFPKKVDGFRVHDGSYLRVLPVCPFGTLVNFRETGDNCKMLVLGGTTAEQHAAYLGTLTAAGFDLLASREIHGNRFAVLKKANGLYHVNFTPHNGYLRLIAEPLRNAPLQLPDSGKVCTPRLFVTGCRFSSTSRYLGVDAGAGNMSYAFRLSNGEFLVIDGGTPADSYADAMMKILTENAPDPDHIVIAAWIITHTHGDHTGCFYRLSEKYASAGKIVIRQLVTNFPCLRDAECYRELWQIRHVKEYLRTYWGDTPFKKVHVGDRLALGDAELDFFYTHEELIRQYFCLLNEKEYNNASLFFRVKIAGETVMITGDTENTANDLIVAMYGEELKSDILQVCHHGGRGGTRDLYRLIDPEVAFFCTSESLYPKYLSLDYNYALVYEQNLKEAYNASETTFAFDLPYHAKGIRIPPFTGTRTYKRAKYLESLAAIEADPGTVQK